MLSRRQLITSGITALSCLGAPAPSKITRFDIHKVTLRWRDMVFLEIHTDSGLTGLGEATLETRADMVEAGIAGSSRPSSDRIHRALRITGSTPTMGCRDGEMVPLRSQRSRLSTLRCGIWRLNGLESAFTDCWARGATRSCEPTSRTGAHLSKDRTPTEFHDLALQTRASRMDGR